MRGLSASCREGATRDGQRHAGSAQLACHFSAIVRTGVGVGLVLGSDRGAAAVSGWRASCDGIPSACLLRSSSSCRAPNDCAHIMLEAARGCSWPRLAGRSAARGGPAQQPRPAVRSLPCKSGQPGRLGAALAASAARRAPATKRRLHMYLGSRMPFCSSRPGVRTLRGCAVLVARPAGVATRGSRTSSPACCRGCDEAAGRRGAATAAPPLVGGLCLLRAMRTFVRGVNGSVYDRRLSQVLQTSTQLPTAVSSAGHPARPAFVGVRYVARCWATAALWIPGSAASARARVRTTLSAEICWSWRARLLPASWGRPG